MVTIDALSVIHTGISAKLLQYTETLRPHILAAFRLFTCQRAISFESDVFLTKTSDFSANNSLDFRRFELWSPSGGGE